jgi:hypothetical protein
MTSRYRAGFGALALIRRDICPGVNFIGYGAGLGSETAHFSQKRRHQLEILLREQLWACGPSARASL